MSTHKLQENPLAPWMAVGFTVQQQRVKEKLVLAGWEPLSAISLVAWCCEGQLSALEEGLAGEVGPVLSLGRYELMYMLSSGNFACMDEQNARLYTQTLDENEILICWECLNMGESPEGALEHYRRQKAMRDQLDEIDRAFTEGASGLAAACLADFNKTRSEA